MYIYDKPANISWMQPTCALINVFLDEQCEFKTAYDMLRLDLSKVIALNLLLMCKNTLEYRQNI